MEQAVSLYTLKRDRQYRLDLGTRYQLRALKKKYIFVVDIRSDI